MSSHALLIASWQVGEVGANAVPNVVAVCSSVCV